MGNLWPVENPRLNEDKSGQEAYDAFIRHHEYTKTIENELAKVHTFILRPYWERLWIVQEFVLAKALVVACGRYAVPFAALNLLNSVFMQPKDLRSVGIRSLRIDRLLDWRHVAAASRASPDSSDFFTWISKLSRALEDFHVCECVDPRDRVYGLLAMYG